MTKQKHTPGPWEVKHYQGQRKIFGGTLIASVGNEWTGNDLIADANARLIAAAPELLEACRSALAYINNVLSGFLWDAAHGYL